MQINNDVILGFLSTNLKCLLYLSTFVLGSESNSILDAAIRGQSLTYQGVAIALVIVLVFLLIWFAKIQFQKEEKLTDRLVQLTSESTKIVEEKAEEAAAAINENTLALQTLKLSVDSLTEDIRRIEKEIEEWQRRRYKEVCD